MTNGVPDWFGRAKLGIFVHYGVYAVDGVAESWSFFNGRVDKSTYDAQLDGFGAERFDADAWAELFKAAGARYAVLTTKHHDGWALWDTSVGKSTVERTGRDIVAEYVEACRRTGLKVGLYYSHLDWSHPDYASVRRPDMTDDERGNPYAHPAAGDERPEAWERFLAFHRAQLDELVDRFAPDLLWFDGDWERDPDQWRMGDVREHLRERAPRLVCNGRMTGGFGDYATPEQGVPVEPPPDEWELCLTLNDSWGFQHHDHNYKSVHQVVRIFAETISAGGNLLLDVGPRADGSIPDEASERLRALGEWIGRHERAVFDTGRGLPHGHFWGPTTISNDGRRLYLFVLDVPREDVSLRGLGAEVTAARVVGTGADVAHHRIGGHLDNAGWDVFTVPAAELDDVCTVIEVDLAEPVELRRTHTRD